MTHGWLRHARTARGAAMIEVALTLPLLLVLSISVFEFGRAYQHWQVLTNAAREGARVASLPGISDDAVRSRVAAYLEGGQLAEPDGGWASIVEIERAAEISIGTSTDDASTITLRYPFKFMVLQPVMQLVVTGSTVGAPITLAASATMRNE